MASCGEKTAQPTDCKPILRFSGAIRRPLNVGGYG